MLTKIRKIIHTSENKIVKYARFSEKNLGTREMKRIILQSNKGEEEGGTSRQA